MTLPSPICEEPTNLKTSLSTSKKRKRANKRSKVPRLNPKKDNNGKLLIHARLE